MASPKKRQASRSVYLLQHVAREDSDNEDVKTLGIYPIDPAEASKCYQRAFDQEHPETLYFYAIREFVDGRPTEEALRLLRKAAEKGFKQAGYVLQPYLH